MPDWNDLSHLWSTLTEVDTAALREQAQKPLRVAILGSDATAVQWLVDQLRTDPFNDRLHALPHTLWPYPLPVPAATLKEAAAADLVLLAIPAAQSSLAAEREAFAFLRQQNPRLTPIILHIQTLPQLTAVDMSRRNWRGAVEVVASPRHLHPLATDLIPTLIDLFPEQHVALAHHIPALREDIVRHIINETCVANAGYAAGTGLAEIIPVLDIPFNVADMVVLTKNQGLMAYKLALCLGQDISPQELAVQLVGLLGGGFMWRELARRLVGFIPLWGLIPKIAVAYAGTYVTGQAVLHWYAYGQKLSPQRLRQLYAQALIEGRRRAAALVPRRRLRLPSLRRRSSPPIRHDT